VNAAEGEAAQPELDAALNDNIACACISGKTDVQPIALRGLVSAGLCCKSRRHACSTQQSNPKRPPLESILRCQLSP
jgi:hypothetical protein